MDLDEKPKWQRRTYNPQYPNDQKTLFGSLTRIATSRAVYLSIIKMTQENYIDVGHVIIEFVTNSYGADLSMSIRRLVESNRRKPIEKQVNSIQALVENLDCSDLNKRMSEIKSVLGDAPNKVYGHLDLKYSDGKRNLEFATYNEF